MSARPASKVRVEAVLKRATEPIFLLGRERHVIFFNRACEQLTGHTADQVVGLCCSYRGPTGSNTLPDVAASLAAPPQVFEGEPATVPSLFIRPTGERLWRQIFFFPCHDEAGRLLGALGLVSDRTQSAAEAAEAPHIELHAGLLKLRDRLYRRYGFDSIVGVSLAMRRVADQVRAASQADVNVLVWGDPGTGKELVARTIHYQSGRREEPLVPVDCSMIPPEMLDEDLFGPGPGNEFSWPRGRLGLLAAARGGTLLLKHLSKLPRDLQSRLAETLCHPVTGQAVDAGRQPSGVRIIAADWSDPAEALAREELRSDLFFALSTLVIQLPALRDRTEDLPLLAQMCVESVNAAGDKQVAAVSAAAMDILRVYDWPGNVRELEEVIRLAHAQCRSSLIQPDDLTPQVQGALGAAYAPPPPADERIDLSAVLVGAERKLIERALERARGNKSRAAELLSISRPRLYRRMETLGMEGGISTDSSPLGNADNENS